MKKLMLIIALSTFAVATNAQKSEKESKKQVNVPETVKKSFAAAFPKVVKVKWSIEKPGEYEAEFIDGKIESSALYDAKGKWLATETEIAQAQLPQAVKTSLAKEFAGFKINEVEQVESQAGISYEMEAKKGKTEYELVFDANGKLLKKETETEKVD
ncbi:MAG: PepSY-like domain-containing protein [Bacteroidota bacterium]|nr:PepSY-like domain-containing protein [Bacteroidota bacterium]